MKGEFKKARQLILQILTVIVVFAAALYGLWRINLIRLPAFVENMFVVSDESPDSYVNDGYEIFEYIGSSDSAETELMYPEITPENLVSLLESAEPYSNYYWESKTEVFSSTGSTVSECKSRISGNRYNVEILNEQGLTVRKCISDGVKTYITTNSGGGSKTAVFERGLTDFYSDASIIPVDFFKNTEFSLEDTEIRHVTNKGYNLVCVTFSYERSGITVENNYMISLDYGVVLFAECFENGEPVYKLSTDSIYSLSSLDDELFQIN